MSKEMNYRELQWLIERYAKELQSTAYLEEHDRYLFRLEELIKLYRDFNKA